MTRTAAIAMLLTLCTASTSIAAGAAPSQAPSNDSLAGAIAATLPFAHSGTTVGATNEPDEVDAGCGQAADKGVWYRLDVSAGIDLLLDTNGGSAIDTVLSVWSGTGHPLTPVACNDDGPSGVWSVVSLRLMPGLVYYAKVSGLGGEQGNFVFNVRHAPAAPLNDDLADAVDIGALPYTDASVVGTQTNEPGEAAPSCGNADPAVWYRLSVQEDSRVALYADAAAEPPGISTWRGTAHPLQELACADDARGGAPLTISLSAGETVLIRVAPEDGVVSGLEFFADIAAAPPENDDPSGAVVIPELPYTSEQSTKWATDGPAEPRASCAGGEVENGVWFRYDSPAAERLAIETWGTDYSNTVSLWRPGPGGALEEIECRAETTGSATLVVRDLAAGETVLIKVGGRLGRSGTLKLQAAVVDPPPNDNLAQAVTVDSLPFSQGANARWATAEPGEVGASCPGPRFDRGIWYRVPASLGGRVGVEVTAGVPTVVSVWSGGPGHPLTEVACSLGRVVFDLVPGADRYVRVEPTVRVENHPAMQIDFVEAPPPPPNDRRERAIVIPSFPFTDEQDLTGAAPDPGDLRGSCEQVTPDPGFAIWYRFTAQAAEEILLTAGVGAFTVSLWTEGGGNAAEVACSGQRVIADVVPGQDYLVRVARQAAPAVRIVFAAAVVTRPPNDNVADAMPVTSLPFANTAATFAATNEPGELDSGCGGGGELGVWYRYTATRDIGLLVDTRDSDPEFDTVLSAWTGADPPVHPMQSILCNDDASFDLWSQLLVRAQAGQTIYFRAGGLGGSTGRLEFHVREAGPPPANDNLANAAAITDIARFGDTRQTISATREVRETTSSCNPIEVDDPDKSVWYRYEPDSAITAALSTEGSNFDTVLSVWTGGPGHPLQELLCNDDAGIERWSLIEFNTEPDQTYFIQATGSVGDSGDLRVAGLRRQTGLPGTLFIPSVVTP